MRTARPYLWTLGLLWGLPALLVAGGYSVLDKEVQSGTCRGIGIGCRLSDADGLVFMFFVLGVPGR